VLTELEQVIPETVLMAVYAASQDGNSSRLYSYISSSLGLPLTSLTVARKVRDVVNELIVSGHVRRSYRPGYSTDDVRPSGRTTYFLTEQGILLFQEIYGPR
jgi:hypothetical protein